MYVHKLCIFTYIKLVYFVYIHIQTLYIYVYKLCICRMKTLYTYVYKLFFSFLYVCIQICMYTKFVYARSKVCIRVYNFL
mgnify:CR=1 FL=1